MKKINPSFYARDASEVAKALLGKVLRHFVNGMWLQMQITETEAYYLHEKASHASLGFTEKRKALFMPAGTIYMYYARGGDSFNISVQGPGNAVLIKSAIPYPFHPNSAMIQTMLAINPIKFTEKIRDPKKLGHGQTILCRSLALKVTDWNGKVFQKDKLEIIDIGYRPDQIKTATRRGIPKGRDEHLLLRFIDQHYLF